MNPDALEKVSKGGGRMIIKGNCLDCKKEGTLKNGLCKECYNYDNSKHTIVSPEAMDKKILKLDQGIAKQDQIIVELKSQLISVKASLVNIDEISSKMLELMNRRKN